MARVDESYASDVFPVERPPPQDPGLMQRVVEWLQLQQPPRRAPAPLPPRTRPETPLAISDRDPVANWATWRLAQAPDVNRLGQEVADWDIRTQAEPQGPESAKLRESMVGGGPIGVGAPGGALAGYVRMSRSGRTGLPTRVEAGPGPPQRALPPGQTEAPATLYADLSGRPGGPLHVDYFGGMGETAHRAREATVGQTRGGGIAEGREIMNELVNLGAEGGYTGVAFYPLSSSSTRESEQLARAAGLGTRGLDPRAEGRLRLNEAYIGAKAVPRPGGYEIPFPETLPPKPPWYEAGPPIDPSQHVRTPEAAAQYRRQMLDEAEWLAREMADLRRQGTDPAAIRSLAEGSLEARRRQQPPSIAAGTALTDLQQRLREDYPQAQVSAADLARLMGEFRQHYGHDPRVPEQLRRFAITQGHVSEADMAQMLGPRASTGGPAPGGATAGFVGQSPQDVVDTLRSAYRTRHGVNPSDVDQLRTFAVNAGLVRDVGEFDHLTRGGTSGFGASAAYTMGAQHGAPAGQAARGNPPIPAQDAANLLESYRVAYRNFHGRLPATLRELRQFTINEGYTNPLGFDQIWTNAYGEAPPLGGGTGPAVPPRWGAAPRPSVPPQPSQARVEGGQRGAEARREAERADVLRGRIRRGVAPANVPPGSLTTPAEEALLRRVQERWGGRMAEAETQAQRRAERQAGQGELFRGTEPTRAARAEPAPRRRAQSLNAAEQRAREAFQADPAEQARRTLEQQAERGEPGVAARAAWDDPVVQGGIERFRQFHGRDPQNPREVLDFSREVREPHAGWARDLFVQYHGRDPRTPQELLNFLPEARAIQNADRMYGAGRRPATPPQ